MVRTLSSSLTPVHKFLTPVVWVGVIVVFTPAALFGGDKPADVGGILFVLLLWILGAALIYWTGTRLKKVTVDDNYLYVSNYLRDISIPLAHMIDVTENAWLNIHPVTIHLSTASEFGKKIVFMPEVRLFALWSSHPVVSELKEIVRMNSMAGVPHSRNTPQSHRNQS